jgi:hypothetical protein
MAWIYYRNVLNTQRQCWRIYLWFKLVYWRNLINKWLGLFLGYWGRSQFLLSLFYLSTFNTILFKGREFLIGLKLYLLRYHFISNFKKDKKIFMSMYLVFTIVYCYVFQGLNLSILVVSKTDPVHTWYLALLKQKMICHFYEVYDSFLSYFKKLMFGNNTSRLSLEATIFLDKRKFWIKWTI